MPSTIFIVDDELPVRKAVARVLRSAGFNTATFATPQEFLVSYDVRMPGCVVLDVAMPGLNGLELQRTLAERGCDLPIIFLTGRADIPMSVQAMKGGAIDFLTKPVHDLDLLEAVGRALAQDAAARKASRDLEGLRARVASLTPREREVLIHVVSGRLNKQIARDLGIVEQTIKVHRARVMEKMGVQSVAELVRVVERLGLGDGK
jgi:FixJ family two-component response regulator